MACRVSIFDGRASRLWLISAWGILSITLLLMEDGRCNTDWKPTYEKFDFNLRSEVALLKNYNLLSCFKKDLHKVETFLRVMKCRRFREISCVP
uniref:Uncharacterized protein n=1 Tax=Pseudonaja textilis TaxID=8673 RepID=A0A670ZQD2_PSETE